MRASCLRLLAIYIWKRIPYEACDDIRFRISARLAQKEKGSVVPHHRIAFAILSNSAMFKAASHIRARRDSTSRLTKSWRVDSDGAPRLPTAAEPHTPTSKTAVTFCVGACFGKRLPKRDFLFQSYQFVLGAWLIH